ncbi:DUF4262 domain-containing protein [Terriglobus albidus]|uniref:DUF4262 domain-containing protein n=1 Tax=Terriglobus albidus TaxID=1592106 RepID=UPI0021E07825|nr:DUF4262 domain-containing protein [Terriglobus albidus]
MKDQDARIIAIKRIEENIARHGHHTYLVAGAPLPHFAYTIGLSPKFGAELIFAGGYFYPAEAGPRILDAMVVNISANGLEPGVDTHLPPYGSFSLRAVHSTWSEMMILGALDYYRVASLPAFQVVPDAEHRTVDVPNMREPWNPRMALAWRWLKESWDKPIPAKSVALTNIEALRGQRITEAARWEEDEWELFAGAGPDVQEQDRRVVPIGILLESDPTLAPVVDLSVSKALWRDTESDWHPWG